jgi:tetratricopeptide (TPR) repeat protein
MSKGMKKKKKKKNKNKVERKSSQKPLLKTTVNHEIKELSHLKSSINDSPITTVPNDNTEIQSVESLIVQSSSFSKIQNLWQKYVSADLHPLALTVMRLSFFLLLAYDLWWIALSHAPRYGAGAFNVAHFPWIDQIFPIPTIHSIGVLYILVGVLSVIHAFGLGGRVGVVLITLLYNFAYFWSQADSYQHHYLIGLCLFIFAFMPVTKPTWSTTIMQEHTAQDLPKTKSVYKDIALDLLLIQLALIYFWTGIAKYESVWLSGKTLSSIIVDPDVRNTILDWGQTFGWQGIETFKALAYLVMIGEILAAIAWIFKACRPWAVLVIPWFHIMVEWIGFDIELFSYYMLILNFCLLSPYKIWEGLHKILGKIYIMISSLLIQLHHAEDQHDNSSSSRLSRRLPYIVWSIVIVIITLQIQQLPVEGHTTAAYIVALLLLGLTWSIKKTLQTQKTISVIIALLFIVSIISVASQHLKSSDFAFNYYRMWGGDLKRRQSYQQSIEVYRKVNRYQKADLPARHMTLASIYQKLGRNQDAIDMYQEGIRRWSVQLHQHVTSLNQKEAQVAFQKAAKKVKIGYQKLLGLVRQNQQSNFVQELEFLWQEESKVIREGYKIIKNL